MPTLMRPSGLDANAARGTCAAALGAAAMLVTATTAEARIACNKGYQTVQGNEISTPYCQDQYVADVARQYGVRTSGAAVRNNPNHKREVCRLIGRDIRVQQACIDSFPSGRGSRF